MGTENILFLDLVLVSRGTIIPESSLSCALITCEHVFHFFFFFTFVGLKIHVLSKNVEGACDGCFCECVLSAVSVCEGGELSLDHNFNNETSENSNTATYSELLILS